MAIRPTARPRAAIAAALALTMAAGACSSAASSPDAASPTSTAGNPAASSADRSAPDTTGAATPEELTWVETPLAYESGTLAPVGDDVWVFPHLDAVTVHIDGPTFAADHEVPLIDHASGAADADNVWAVFPLFSPSLFQFDPLTMTALGRWDDLPISDPVPAFGSGWAAASDGLVYRAHADTQELESFPTGGPSWPWLGATTTAVWTLNGDVLQHIDPATSAVDDRSALLDLLPQAPRALSTAGDLLIFTTGEALHIVDPDARELIGSVPAPDGYSVVDWYAAIDSHDGRFWVGLIPGDDPVVDIPRGAPTPDTLIVQVEAASAKVTATVATPFPEDFEPTGDGGLWIAPLRQKRVLRVTAPTT